MPTIKYRDIYEDSIEIIKKLYGKQASFREGQYEAIEATLTNKRTLVVQKTGWGKSLVYFVCTKLMREKGHGVTIVVSPLLILMQNQIEAAEKLKKLSGMDKVFFGNSGAEANEGAIKLARKYATDIDPEKIQIISAVHSFHGRTLATLTATGQDHYHHGFGPLPEGFDYVPFNDIEALEAKMSDKTCAVMLEAIQGEGGVHVPDEDYLPKVRALCDKYNAVLIFDEVQCGMGRTGTFFGCQQFGVKPDIVTLAKGLAGGVPIGAFMATDKVANAFKPGDHGSTFGGNPLACAAACVVLDALVNDNLMENAKEVGAYLKAKFDTYKEKYPTLIKEVRGRGLILGMELTRPGREIANECLDWGAIINCTAGNILRFVPPLNITKAHVDELITILDKVLPKYV